MATRILTLDELVVAARRLSPRDRLRLIERLAADLEPSASSEPRVEPASAEPTSTEPATTPDASAGSGGPRQSLYGLWKDIVPEISVEEIAEMRREAWAGLGEREI